MSALSHVAWDVVQGVTFGVAFAVTWLRLEKRGRK